ncbi:hypothetical protein PIB30_085263 [Stylosanthes scabra]|uniref:Uncharacterized protein n=1 Tax=Stylosanthes scabra TaxID=79078 RepID=A0ABU6UTL3_9FABA|nr:hypothetical protein [Stylosanthes scabra]
MSGTNTNIGNSDLIGLTASSGATAPIGPNTSTTSAQSSAAVSISVGNPIVADTNAKYEQLAKRFDTALGGSEDLANDTYAPHGDAIEETFEVGHSSEHEDIPVPERLRLLRRGENAENVLHNVSSNSRLARRQVRKRAQSNWYRCRIG